MLRGQRALTAIVSNDIAVVSEKHVKGCYTDDRDNALACRFYYHGYIIGKRYDVCLAALSKEFYLSETVVAQRLMTRQDYLKQMRVDNINAKDLQMLFPFYNWR